MKCKLWMFDVEKKLYMLIRDELTMKHTQSNRSKRVIRGFSENFAYCENKEKVESKHDQMMILR